MKGIRETLFAVLCCGVGGIGFWLGRDARPPTGEDQPSASQPAGEEATVVATVQTRVVASATLARTVDAYGTVQVAPGSSTTLSAPFDASVVRIIVVPGAVVAADADVIEIGPTAELQLQFKQAEDAVAATQRTLEDVRRRLSEQLATNAEVAIAEQARQAAGTQLDSLQRRGANGSRVLKAGTAGAIAQVGVQQGQIAQAGTPLLTIASNDKFEALVGFEPTDASELKVGDAVQLRDVHSSADALPVAGIVRLIAPQVNTQTHLRDASITLADGSGLMPGTFVVATAELNRATGLSVPRSAVTPDDDEDIVFVVEDGKASRRVVRATLRGREAMLVTSDALHEGDEVVVVGNAELEDGMAVKVAAPDDAASQPTTTRSEAATPDARTSDAHTSDSPATEAK